jgi:hypothetical protein
MGLVAVIALVVAFAAASPAQAEEEWWYNGGGGGGGGGGGCTDSDGDGTCDYEDDCPNDPDGSTDTDGDGTCDAEDPCPRNEHDRCNGNEGRGTADCGAYGGIGHDPDGDGVANRNDDDDDCDRIADTLEDDLGYLAHYDKDNDDDGKKDFEDLVPNIDQDSFDLTLRASKFQEYIKSDEWGQSPGEPYLDGAGLGFDGSSGYPHGVAFDNLKKNDHKHDGEDSDCSGSDTYCKEYQYSATKVLSGILPQDPRNSTYAKWRAGSPEVTIQLPMKDHDHGPDGDDEYYGSTYDKARILRKISDGKWFESDKILYDTGGDDNGRFIWDWKSPLKSCSIAIFDEAERGTTDDYVTGSELPGDPSDDERCLT